MSVVDKVLNNKKWMFFILIILLVIVAIKVLCFPVYEANTVIMIDIKNRATSVDAEQIDLSNYLGYVRNYEELLRSGPVIRKVVEELNLYEDFVPKYFSNIHLDSITDVQKERLIRSTVDYFQKSGITLTSPPFTNLIDVQVRYKDGQKAATIANTLIKTYMQWTVGFLHSDVDSVISYLNGEVDKARDQLERSEERLRKFKTDNHIIDLPEEVKTYLQMIPLEFQVRYQNDQTNQLKLLEIKNELNLERKNSLYQLMQYTQANQLKALEVTNALNLETNRSLYQLMQTTNDKLLELQVELMRLKELYTDESPQVKYMKMNIQKLQGKLNEISLQIRQQDEFNKKQVEEEAEAFVKKLNEISSKAGRQDDISRQEIENETKRFKEYAKDYQIDEKYLDRFKGLPAKEMMLTRLEREVKINEMAYTFLVQEDQKANLLKAKQTTENIKLVSQAEAPLKPKGRLTGLLTGAFISVFLTSGLPFLWRNRKILN